jgi:hypothetical protein
MGKVYNAPKEVGNPPKFNIDTYLKDEEVWLRKLQNWAKKNGSGTYAGELVSFPYADGYAMYVVVALKPVSLIHVPLGDAWHYPYITRLTAADLKAAINRSKAMKKLFKTK